MTSIIKLTKLEISKLFRPLDLLTSLPRDNRAPDHHGTDTDNHDTPMLDAVNRHDDPDVLAIHVQRAANGHGVDSIILAIDGLGLAHDAVDGDMEAMIVLRRESEDSERSVRVPLCVFRVSVAEKSLDRKFSAFDPDPLRIFHAVEDYRAAVGW